MEPILNGATAYGINISRRETLSFLMREYGLCSRELPIANLQLPASRLIHITYHPGSIQPGTVIITTSLKHARDLGSELRKIHGKHINILIQ